MINEEFIFSDIGYHIARIPRKNSSARKETLEYLFRITVSVTGLRDEVFLCYFRLALFLFCWSSRIVPESTWIQIKRDYFDVKISSVAQHHPNGRKNLVYCLACPIKFMLRFTRQHAIIFRQLVVRDCMKAEKIPDGFNSEQRIRH